MTSCPKCGKPAKQNIWDHEFPSFYCDNILCDVWSINLQLISLKKKRDYYLNTKLPKIKRYLKAVDINVK